MAAHEPTGAEDPNLDQLRKFHLQKIFAPF